MFPSGSLAPLANPNFRYLIAGFAIGQMLMPLQFITQILWVQHNAPEDIWLILVAFIATCRGVGALVFGLYGGALADRYNRKTILLIILCLQIVTTAGIAGLMFMDVGDKIGFAIFFVLTFIGSGLQSIDGPTRLSIVPDVLGPELTSAGMSLNQVAGQVAMPVAMLFTGMLIDSLGFGGAYLFSIFGLMLSIFCIAMMSYVPDPKQVSRNRQRYGVLEAINDVRIGLRYAKDHKIIWWVIILMVTMMSFGYPATASLGPTWVTTVIEVEIAKMGYVVMFWGIGSFIAAIFLTRYASIKQRGMMLVAGAILFSVSFVVFTSDHTPLNAIIGNVGLGAGMTMTMVSSTILIQHLVPNEIRGRIMSIFQMNMALAQLMTMPVALLGQWLTLQVLFPYLAVITLGMVILIVVSQPQLRQARVET
ncbi:MAG: MFS family permease [Flavobacterium sp.]|jgi:MFS family permease